MTQANLRKRASPRRSRMRAFAVTAAWCGVAAAQIGANPAPSCVPQIGIGIWSTAPLVVAAWAPVFDAAVGQSYSFSPIVSNAAGPVVFSIANQPPWAVFDYTTGQLSGIPSNTDVGTYPGVVIAVSDGINSASLPIPLQVLPSQPVPPVIMGTPPFVTVAGGLYLFVPFAAGNQLSFTVQNLPTWANFNPLKGILWGTPTGSGTYNNIIISTTDGTYSSALPPFSITVTGPPSSATASGTVSWTAPTRNTDGSALTDLMGVRIYYGTSAMNLNQAVQAPSTTPASCLIGSLTSGTWYFGATAYNAAGQESALSPIVGLTIP